MSETQLSGKWTWNDITNTLEFVSNQATDSQGRKKKDQRRELKSDTRSAGGYSGNRTKRRQGTGTHHKSPVRQPIKSSPDHLTVTIQDVKDVARQMLLEVDDVPECFDDLSVTPEYDDFLLFLFNYFHWFFEKRAKENNPNPVHIEPSAAEKELYEHLCRQQRIAQKLLGRVYGALILGIGLCEHHHMLCGMKLVSNTYRDRCMFEALYTFSTFVVWIAFRRLEHDVIKNEINRLLRTDTFNPVLRTQTVPPTDEESDSPSEERLTPAEYRRKHHNRKPFKTIVNQRSETLVSILPLPKEEANWLFKQSATGSNDQQAKVSDDEMFLLDYDRTQLRLGIVGEPLSMFDPLTLIPVVVEEKERTPSKHEMSASDIARASSSAALQDKPRNSEANSGTNSAINNVIDANNDNGNVNADNPVSLTVPAAT